MLKLIHQDKNPVFCVITPLLPEHKISKETKITIKRNDLPFVWYSYTGVNNVMKNFKLALDELGKLPKYVIKVDNDTIWNRKTLDNLIIKLEHSHDNVAFSYCSFEYKGVINRQFLAIPYDYNMLRRGNYISSNSMFKSYVLKDIELVVDDKYRRLLDWCYYLKLLNNGYIGVNCTSGYFIAKSSSDSISAGSLEDYKIKYNLVKKDFC